MTLPQNPYPFPQPVPQPKRGRRIFVIAGAAASVMVLLCCGVGLAAMNGEEEPSKLGAVSVPSTEPVKATATPEEPTAAATTEPVATTTPTTTEPAVAKPRVIKGRGDDVVDIPPLTDLSVVVFDCRCSSNTVLKSDGPESLLVNEIGAYKGKRWINLEDGAQTTQLEIEAAGRWTLTIGSVDQLATKAASGKASGKGDDVVVLGGNATKAKITHSKGSSNFVINAYSLETGEGGLLVNEIGGYSGTRPLQAPALVEVTADGKWTISPS
ncbi:hypothetical protein AMIS_67010 [Actinoplanes missouriensis 431]|uniref:Uncharacterized protein n=1 Tax=Actinoplanes missouriensis (strain ATCC 14538 / DSM 43046 / CBS 188.64 / JCM 3121 / NBRC 102363 / NCIMB 12654 / NRRL B-3342 / UNCC 431) TaxID=512565 RepID=I0HFY4_ACTM4|nr:hypothetical protein AMIS_67010 [Actinoplanes missouriensis 431]